MCSVQNTQNRNTQNILLSLITGIHVHEAQKLKRVVLRIQGESLLVCIFT